MAIQIGKYKRPGIFVQEIDRSIITSPASPNILPVLVIGVSKVGPPNTAVLMQSQSDLQNYFGDIDRQLERKESFFQRTISQMLQSGPVYGLNLLLTDDALDQVEYQSLSTAAQYFNDITRDTAYRKYFDTTGFWKRDTLGFDDFAILNPGSENRPLNLTNLGSRPCSVFIFLSTLGGFDITLLEWYGSVEAMPTYVYPSDLASDYLVDVVVVGGDWSNYGVLSVDPRWSQYFDSTGLIKSQISNFANDRNVTLLAYYEGVSLIPYFRDNNGKNIFIETVINNDTDTTGLFCAFNNEIVETDYPMGFIDLIGNSLVDDITSNPPVSDESYYENLDKNDGVDDGDISINFLSYQEKITYSEPFTNRVLDRPGNVFSLFGTNSAVKLNTSTHSYNNSNGAKGGVQTGPEGLNIVNYPNRTYWFAEGYVNDFYRSTSTITANTQSITINYTVATSSNGYAINGGNYISLAGTYSVNLVPSSYPSLTASYIVAVVLGTTGVVSAVQTTTSGNFPSVAATDIVLGYGTVSLTTSGTFVTGSVAFTDFTVNTTSTGGAAAYLPLLNGTDYTVATSSTSGQIVVTFLGTNQTPSVTNYQTYRRFKAFNSMLTYVDTASTYQGLILLNPQTTTDKNTLSGMTVSVVNQTTLNKSINISTGLAASSINSIVTNGELALYLIDDEFIVSSAGFVTKNTIATFNGSTSSFGVVGQYSKFYQNYNQGLISNKDLFYQNTLYGGSQVTFLPGSSVTASLAGYNYLIFQINTDPIAAPFATSDTTYFNYINSNELGDSFTPPVYQWLVAGVINVGAFTPKYDQGINSTNLPNFSVPSSAGGSVGGRAYILGSASNGVFNFNNGASYSFFAFEVTQTVQPEDVSITKLFAYTDGNLDSPIYQEIYEDSSNNLNVIFSNYKLSTPSLVACIDPGQTPAQALARNTTIYVKSQLSDFKESIIVQNPVGWVPLPNTILILRADYPDLQIGNYLEAYFDPTTLQTGQMPKKLTRILSKSLWTNTDYVIVSTDAAINLYSYGGYQQTYRYTTLDSYADTYKAIVLDGFTIRQASLPDGTDTQLTAILNLVANGTPLFGALTNKEAFDFRYLVDSFGLGLTPNSKQPLVDICGSRLDAFGIINMPSLRQFKNSLSPSFLDDNGILDTAYIATGGNQQSNPAFLYSFGTGAGVSAVGYFLPYVTINDNGRPASLPPAAFVGQTYMRKQNNQITSIVPWTVAAGVNNGRILGISSLEEIFSDTDLDNLNQAQMNPLTYHRNRGYVIETENTAQTLYKSALSYIHVREVLIELERELGAMLLDFQWKFNTADVRAQIKLQADTICEKYVNQSGLYNYFNKIDEENNTPDIIDAQIGVLDTYCEPVKAMGIIVNNITILRTGAIKAGGFINS